jgi:hypothetical protein
LTHLPEVLVPETDHSGSPDEEHEQRSVLIPETQCSVLTNAVPESPSSLVYIPETMPASEASPDRSPGSLGQKTVYPASSGFKLPHYDATIDSPKEISRIFDKALQDSIASSLSPRDPLDWQPSPEAYLGLTLSEIYRRDDDKQSIQPSYTACLPFGGRDSSLKQAPIESPTRKLPASPGSPGPTPFDPNKDRFQPLELGSPTVESSTKDSCLSALCAKQQQLLTSFVPSKALESSAGYRASIEHLVTTSIAASVAAHKKKIEDEHECLLARQKEELAAECTRIVSNFTPSIEGIAKMAAERRCRDFLNGGYDALDSGTDVGTAKKKEFNEEMRQLDLEEEELYQEEKRLDQRKHDLNNRKRKIQEMFDSIVRGEADIVQGEPSVDMSRYSSNGKVDSVERI